MSDDYEFHPTNTEEISIDDLKDAFELYSINRSQYEEVKKISNERYADMKLAEGRLCELLEISGLDKFSLPALGTISLVNSLSFQTPKTSEDKAALFGYIRETYGEEELQSYLSINSRTLNSFLKDEYDKMIINDDETPFIPGVGAPTKTTTLRFNKARK